MEQSGMNKEIADTENQQRVELKKLDLLSIAISKTVPDIIEYLTKRLIKLDSPVAKSTIWGFVIILGIILVGTFYLVAVGKLAESSFTFVIGTLLGYLLSMAKMMLRRESE